MTELDPRRRTLVLAAMCLTLVLVVAGVSMLTNALPSIAEDLDLSQTQQTWVVDAYALPFAALLLIAGAIGDRYGRRGALLGGSVLFTVGALLASTADTSNQLLLHRVVMGVGAALMMPGTLSTITSVFPADQRARAVGVWSGFAMAGGTLGLLGSGLLLRWFWWGSTFRTAGVLGIVVIAAIVAFVPPTKAEEHVGLDPVGTVLSALAIGGLVFGIIEGPERGWTSTVTVVGLVLGVAAAVAFVRWELRQTHPLLDPRLFRLPGFGTGVAGLFIMFMAMFGFFLVAIQFMQLVLGYTPLTASLGLLPQAVLAIPIAAAAAPLSMRVGQRRLTTIGLLVGAAGLAWLAMLDADSTYWELLIGIVVNAIGVGLAMTPATTAIVNSLPPAKQGVASAVNDTAREVGAALGVAILGSAFNTAYRSGITSHLDGLDPQVAEDAREAPALALQHAAQLGDAGTPLRHAAERAFESGMQTALLLSAGLFVVGAIYTSWRGASRAPAEVAVRLEDELQPDGLLLGD